MTDPKFCDYCGKIVEDDNHHKTRMGCYFCDYECFENFYNGGIEDSDDDFRIVPR